MYLGAQRNQTMQQVFHEQFYRGDSYFIFSKFGRESFSLEHFCFDFLNKMEKNLRGCFQFLDQNLSPRIMVNLWSTDFSSMYEYKILQILKKVNELNTNETEK